MCIKMCAGAWEREDGFLLNIKAFGSSPAELSPHSGLTLAALGVVYGDIGTSPLYALRECFSGSHGVAPTPDNVLGVLSLICWSLLLVVSLKYVLFVLRADNQGEGGILALTALNLRRWENNPGRLSWVLLLGFVGAGLFYGDAIITPAISVLSAVEGIEIATPLLQPYVRPVAIGILLALFAIQHRGTSGIGAWFGPVMVAWFAVLALLGLRQIQLAPEVLWALSPLYFIEFFAARPAEGFFVLGAVFLAMTGAEALYADMGHFGLKPIRRAWFRIVLPALLLNYFGQGALLLRDPTAISNPFYLLAPAWALYPLVALATAATVIASQAVISGTFSLTWQAMRLGYSPRMEVIHTSADERGQIYLPRVNWALFIGVLLLILAFENSSNLSAAYGIAVVTTMLITSLLALFALRTFWRRAHWLGVALVGFFLLIDLAFFSANLSKIIYGGWFPLALGIVLFSLMTTWKLGRTVLLQRLQTDYLSLADFLEMIRSYPPTRVPGTAVFLTSATTSIPHALLHNLKHNKVLHERVALLTLHTHNVPRLPPAERLQIENLGQNFYRVTGHYGYQEMPNLSRLLVLCGTHGLEFDLMDTTFFLSRETLLTHLRETSMALWRQKLFILMSRNAANATDFFHLPANRVVEIGIQVEL